MKRVVLAAAITWLMSLSCSQPSMDQGNVTPAGTVSCALAQAGPAGSQTLFCVETSGLTVNQAQADQGPCETERTDAGAWMFSYDACPREGALGGCRLATDVSHAVAETQWYYAGGLYLGAGGGDAGAADAAMPPCLSNYTSVSP